MEAASKNRHKTKFSSEPKVIQKCFGLGPYYKNKILKTLVSDKAVCPTFVSCFGESMNKVSTKKQLDVHI